MNPEEKRLYLIFLQNKIYRSDAQAYEDLFCEIMEASNPNFKRVKAYGRIGDRKNDGYDPTSGWYCQIYAPEDLHSKEGKAIKKLKEDFDGLLKNWSHISPVLEFKFVLNDKYKGTTPPIEEALSNLSNLHSIPCASFLNKDLENIFDSLPIHKIIQIIGPIPDPNKLNTLDFSALNEVIKHLMVSKAPQKKESRPDDPNFANKIAFNGLSDHPGDLLVVGDYQRGDIDEFFSYRGNLLKLEVQQKFIELYSEGRELWGKSIESSDQIFYFILDSAKPNEEAMYNMPVIALMSYYFEKCDIFEPPEL